MLLKWPVRYIPFPSWRPPSRLCHPASVQPPARVSWDASVFLRRFPEQISHASPTESRPTPGLRERRLVEVTVSSFSLFSSGPLSAKASSGPAFSRRSHVGSSERSSVLIDFLPAMLSCEELVASRKTQQRRSLPPVAWRWLLSNEATGNCPSRLSFLLWAQAQLMLLFQPGVV